MDELILEADAGSPEPLTFVEMPEEFSPKGLKLSPDTVALLQQLTTQGPQTGIQPAQPPQDIFGAIVMIAVALLGGGGAGWQAWFKFRKRWHAEQISALKALQEENKDQDCKLEQLAVQISDLEKLESKLDVISKQIGALDDKIPAPKPAARKRTTKKTEG
jgi:hypothetical protein